MTFAKSSLDWEKKLAQKKINEMWTINEIKAF